MNAPERARYLSPAETAKRLGVSAKALRLYETRGLVAPLRTGAGWRAYGPEQLARLHQVIALKRMGLSLAQVGALLSGHASKLDAVLAAQEQVLAGESARVREALSLVRAARARLANGETLSIDDLATLTKETTMTAKPTPQEMKRLFDPFVEKHFSPEEIADTAQRKFDPAYTQEAWNKLIDEAKAMVARGEDPASPAARDLAKRWRAMVEMFTQGKPDMERRVKAVWNDAMADPKAASQLPLNPEIFAFVAKAAAAKERQ